MLAKTRGRPRLAPGRGVESVGSTRNDQLSPRGRMVLSNEEAAIIELPAGQDVSRRVDRTDRDSAGLAGPIEIGLRVVAREGREQFAKDRLGFGLCQIVVAFPGRLEQPLRRLDALVHQPA